MCFLFFPLLFSPLFLDELNNSSQEEVHFLFFLFLVNQYFKALTVRGLQIATLIYRKGTAKPLVSQFIMAISSSFAALSLVLSCYCHGKHPQIRSIQLLQSLDNLTEEILMIVGFHALLTAEFF